MRNMVIIGSGPAGLTAAVYAARANLQPLLIEGKEPGGQLTLTTLVENYPGFSEGIMGPQLMDEMRKQAQRFGADIVNGYVHAVKLKERPFHVYYGDEEIKAKSVVISTGSSAKLIGIESEIQLMGHGVSTCATCTCPRIFFSDAQRFSSRVRDSLRAPGRLHHDLNGRVGKSCVAQFRFNVFCDHRARRARRRSHGHFDVNGISAGLNFIDQSEIHNVQGNFRVVTFL